MPSLFAFDSWIIISCNSEPGVKVPGVWNNWSPEASELHKKCQKHGPGPKLIPPGVIRCAHKTFQRMNGVQNLTGIPEM